MATRTVREVMTAPPAAIGPEASMAEVWRVLERHGFNSLPVVNPEGILLGIVTKLDLLRLFRPDVRRRMPEPDIVKQVPVSDMMRPGVVSLESHHPVAAAMGLMLQSRLQSLPVVERPKGGPPRLVGIVTRGDLLRCLLAPRAARRRAKAARSA